MKVDRDDVARLFKGSGTAPTALLPGESGFTTRPELVGTFGMVATTYWLATAAGMGILEKGGNAFDAAVAATFVLQVVEPTMCGPAGEAPVILYDNRADKVSVISGQGVAPAAATPDKFRSLGLDLVPGAGLLPAVTPGAFGAMMTLLRDWGSMELRDVMAPAIGYARKGHPMSARVAATIDSLAELFCYHWPTSGATYCPNGAGPSANSLFRNPVLADTFETLVREADAASGGREARITAAQNAFYSGFVAESIDRFCRENEFLDTSGERHGGLMTGDDLAKWRVPIEEPTSLEYEQYTIFKPGPWSQGPVMLQQLALLKGYDLAAMAPDGADFVHTLTECAKLAFADRERFYGDPDFVDVPMTRLLSKNYNDARRALIGRSASGDIRPGAIAGRGGPVVYGLPDGQRMAVQDDGPPVPVQNNTVSTAINTGDTVHLDIVDQFGNMVSVTPSGGWLRSSPTVPELGFSLSNRGQIFTLDEGTPGGIAPGKRPRTTLSPGFANRDGKPYMAFGTPGADRQDQWALQFFLRHVHHGLDLQAAIDSPTFNTAHFPGSFYPKMAALKSLTVEGRFSDDVVADLRGRGHDVTVGEDWSQGRVCAVTRDGDLLKAAASARSKQPYAFGR